MVIVAPSERPQPMDDATMIQPMLRKGAVKDLNPPLQLPEAALHVVANVSHKSDPLRLPQLGQSPLIPRTAVHDRLLRPTPIDLSQLLEELHRGNQSSVPTDAQIENAAGFWVNGGPDPAQPSSQLDPGLIDHDPIGQGALPDWPVGGEGSNPAPYCHVGNADSPLGEKEGSSAQAQTLGVGGQPERDGPGGGPFSLDHPVLAEESASLWKVTVIGITFLLVY